MDWSRGYDRALCQEMRAPRDGSFVAGGYTGESGQPAPGPVIAVMTRRWSPRLEGQGWRRHRSSGFGGSSFEDAVRRRHELLHGRANRADARLCGDCGWLAPWGPACGAWSVRLATGPQPGLTRLPSASTGAFSPARSLARRGGSASGRVRLFREFLKVCQRILVKADRDLTLSPAGVRIPLPLREVIVFLHRFHLLLS